MKKTHWAFVWGAVAGVAASMLGLIPAAITKRL